MKAYCFRESIWSVEDRDIVAKLYKELYQLSKVCTPVSKTKKRFINGDKIKSIKEEIASYQQVHYGFVMPLGKDEKGNPRKIVIDWRETPIERKEILAARNEMFKTIRQKRKQTRKVNIEEKEFLGFEYRKVGGVFTQPNSIKALVGTVNDDKKLAAVKAPHNFQPNNFVGIEIECLITSSEDYLKDKLIEANLQSYVQVKRDGSIRAEEDNERGIELVVLAKEEEIKNIITKVCEVLSTKRIAAKANNSCGLHVHLDMRNRIVGDCFKNLYYAQGIMLGMVPESRRTNDQYCKKNVTPDFQRQLREGSTFNSNGSRYHVINAEAYSKYKTLEVRVHGGTTNATKIINWVHILSAIVNYKGEELTYPIKTIKKFLTTFKINAELETYINKRTIAFVSKTLNEVQYSA